MRARQARPTDPSFVKRIALVAAGLVIALSVGSWLIGRQEPPRTAEKTRTNASRPSWAKEKSAAKESNATTSAAATETVTATEMAAVADAVPVVEAPEETAPAPPVSWEDAQAAWDDGDVDRARDLFTRYTEQKPENPWGHYMKGLSARRAGALEEAELALLDCLALDPDHAKALVNLARVRLDLEQPAQARSPAERAIEIDAANGSAHRVLARVLHTQGLREAAEVAYLRALEIDPDDAWSLNNLGLLRIEGERFEEAVAPLRRACGVDAGQAPFFNNLGIALERSGRYRGAEAAFAGALELDPDYERASVSLARVESLGDEVDEPSAVLAAEPTTTEPPEDAAMAPAGNPPAAEPGEEAAVALAEKPYAESER